MDNKKMREILLEYQNTRDKNEQILSERIEVVNSEFPEIAEVSKEISKTGLKMTKYVLNGAGDEELEKLRDLHRSLIEKKNDILRKYNISPDYLVLPYDCEFCKDTGFLPNGEQCNCLKQKILSYAYKMSNLENLLKRDNFNTFSLEGFSDEPYEGFDLTPRKFMENLKSDLLNYVDDFDIYEKDGGNFKPNLLFTGTTGLGKTFCCSCVAKEILDKGYTVIYQTSFNLMDVIERYKFKTPSFSSIDEENYYNLFDADLLIIDDLGTEIVNSFTVSELFNIINERIIARKKTIISTNLDIVKIRDFYTDRILSRIIGNYKIYEFYGNDFRLRKKY